MKNVIELNSAAKWAPTNAVAAALTTDRAKALAGAKVLVVDDEPDVVRSLVMRLKHAGFDVITAYDGFAATQLALSEAPDVVLLDIGLPCGDGHTVARRLGENVKTMGTPIIFLSARTGLVDRERAVACGACDYITKPFSWERLVSAINEAISPTRNFDL